MCQKIMKNLQILAPQKKKNLQILENVYSFYRDGSLKIVPKIFVTGYDITKYKINIYLIKNLNIY
jgi:hypothetical protein